MWDNKSIRTFETMRSDAKLKYDPKKWNVNARLSMPRMHIQQRYCPSDT